MPIKLPQIPKLNLDTFHQQKVAKLVLVVLSYVLYIGVAGYLLINYFDLKKKSDKVEQTLTGLIDEQQNFKANFDEELFNEHLKLIDKQKIQSELDSISAELERLSATQEGAFSASVLKAYDLYEDFKAKLKRNEGIKVDVKTAQASAEQWGALLLEQNFDDFTTQMTQQNTLLDADYKKYLDSLPKPVPVAKSGSGYTLTTITTERGTTHTIYMIKMPLSQVKVKTINAIEDDCYDNCSTKTLAEYVNENSGIAGMNGNYSCPPDYSACAGKVNSSDYAFYDSNDRKWFNEDARTWSKTGMVTFSGHSYQFYKKSSEYDGDSVEAAISNFPSLLKNGEVVVDEGDLTSFQKVKALRGAIGLGGENIYLVHISNATVTDAAYVMKALGALHALNLDGGGTAALYINGGYVVGPGRRLANAIVLVK